MSALIIKRYILIAFALQAKREGADAVGFFHAKVLSVPEKPKPEEVVDADLLELARLYELDDSVVVLTDPDFPMQAADSGGAGIAWRTANELPPWIPQMVLRRKGGKWYVF